MTLACPVTTGPVLLLELARSWAALLVALRRRRSSWWNDWASRCSGRRRRRCRRRRPGRPCRQADPVAEDAYWRDNYAGRDYVDPGTSYDEYSPADRYG